LGDEKKRGAIHGFVKEEKVCEGEQKEQKERARTCGIGGLLARERGKACVNIVKWNRGRGGKGKGG